MSTRATIRIGSGDEVYYLYRHSDGHPDNVLSDIGNVVVTLNRRCVHTNDDPAMIATAMVAYGWRFDATRLPNYEITSAFHGDESYRYYIRWDKAQRMWEWGTIDNWDRPEAT